MSEMDRGKAIKAINRRLLFLRVYMRVRFVALWFRYAVLRVRSIGTEGVRD